MKNRTRDTIENIVAELRSVYSGDSVSKYFRELADRIEAAHNEGVLKVVDSIMGGRD